jgi:hypothetical protein
MANGWRRISDSIKGPAICQRVVMSPTTTISEGASAEADHVHAAAKSGAHSLDRGLRRTITSLG